MIDEKNEEIVTVTEVTEKYLLERYLFPKRTLYFDISLNETEVLNALRQATVSRFNFVKSPKTQKPFIGNVPDNALAFTLKTRMTFDYDYPVHTHIHLARGPAGVRVIADIESAGSAFFVPLLMPIFFVVFGLVTKSDVLMRPITILGIVLFYSIFVPLGFRAFHKYVQATRRALVRVLANARESAQEGSYKLGENDSV